MPPEMKDAFGFSTGDVVQMLVETIGQDADDNELALPGRRSPRLLTASIALRIPKGLRSPSPSKGRSSTCLTKATACRLGPSTSGS